MHLLYEYRRILYKQLSGVTICKTHNPDFRNDYKF